LAKPEPVQL